MKEIVTRFPPSPTGYLHVGGARTAIFNWLYARHTKGRFILRMEDTDRARSEKKYVDAILDGLKWLGIDWDEGPFFQSDRFDIYREYVERLIESGDAYYCDCPPERLERIRKEAMESGGKPKYDGACRDMGKAPKQGSVVRFKAPLSGQTVVPDLIKGNIIFENSELDDFIIVRSDNTPTYNFVVVIDDLTMGINTIIRGDDHVMNTPKQILIYRALKAELPVFAHVPMVLGKDRSRLSKRHGALSVTAYREMGYLPDALVNYLVRLGWSCGDQEFFTREELIEKFNLENIGKSAGVFDPEKLLALNAEHIRKSKDTALVPHLKPFLEELGIRTTDDDYLARVIGTLKLRSKTLKEMARGASFYFVRFPEFDEKGVKKFFTPATPGLLSMIRDEIKEAGELSQPTQEAFFKRIMEKTGLGFGKIAQPLRLALTGSTVSPGIFEVIEVLGKERVLERIDAAINFIGDALNF